MHRFAWILPIAASMLVPRPGQAQILELRQNIFGMD